MKTWPKKVQVWIAWDGGAGNAYKKTQIEVEQCDMPDVTQYLKSSRPPSASHCGRYLKRLADYGDKHMYSSTENGNGSEHEGNYTQWNWISYSRRLEYNTIIGKTRTAIINNIYSLMLTVVYLNSESAQ